MNPIGDLHRQSSHYFDALPKPEKDRCMEFFKKCDEDGSKKVSRRELALALPDKVRKQIMGYFDVLDIDCDGFLDFEECVTLYYLLNVPGKVCTGCHKILSYKTFCAACGIENGYLEVETAPAKQNANTMDAFFKQKTAAA